MHAERSPGDARMTGFAQSEPADTPKRQSPHPPFLPGPSMQI